MGFLNRLYEGKALNDKTPKAIISKLRKMKAIGDSDKPILVYGSTTMGSPATSIVLLQDALLFLNASGMLMKHNSFPYRGIGSVSIVNKGALSTLVLGIRSAGEEALDIPMTADEAHRIQQVLMEKIAQPAPSPSTQATASVDPVAEIERYHVLKEKGIITSEEFEAKKKQLLGL